MRFANECRSALLMWLGDKPDHSISLPSHSKLNPSKLPMYCKLFMIIEDSTLIFIMINKSINLSMEYLMDYVEPSLARAVSFFSVFFYSVAFLATVILSATLLLIKVKFSSPLTSYLFSKSVKHWIIHAFGCEIGVILCVDACQITSFSAQQC